jgi:hypothetical protein
MRKLFLLVLAITGCIIIHAQENPVPDSIALKEYTGRYAFPDGSQVGEIKVVFETGMLMAQSDQGNSELKRVEKDVFEVVAYSGTATFKRDDKGKVNGIYIQIGDMILDGKKSDGAAINGLAGY